MAFCEGRVEEIGSHIRHPGHFAQTYSNPPGYAMELPMLLLFIIVIEVKVKSSAGIPCSNGECVSSVSHRHILCSALRKW